MTVHGATCRPSRKIRPFPRARIASFPIKMVERGKLAPRLHSFRQGAALSGAEMLAPGSADGIGRFRANVYREIRFASEERLSSN